MKIGNMTIAQRISYIIEMKNLSQKDFGIQVDTSQATISRIIKEKDYNPSFTMVHNIAKAFPKISLHWLILGEGSMMVPDGYSAPDEVRESDEVYRRVVLKTYLKKELKKLKKQE